VPGWPPVREHDVTALTLAELERARRELVASLALARPRLTGLRPDPGTAQRDRRRTGQAGHHAAGRVVKMPEALNPPDHATGPGRRRVLLI
jgi:hypothetical protein